MGFGVFGRLGILAGIWAFGRLGWIFEGVGVFLETWKIWGLVFFGDFVVFAGSWWFWVFWVFWNVVRLGFYWGIGWFGGTFAVIGGVMGVGFWGLWKARGVRGTPHESLFSSL